MRAAIFVIVLLLAAAAGYFLYRQSVPPTDEAESVPVEAGEPAEVDQQGVLDLPRFDIVRVSRGGFAVIAGTAEPGATVDVLANGEPIDSVIVGEDGAWASQVDTPLSGGPVELTLRMTPVGADGESADPVASEGSVIVYVAEGENDAPVVVRTMPGGASEVLQSANAPTDALGPLVVETIDYDASNSVIIAGRASPDSMVQLFLDGAPIGAATTADAEGRWEVTAEVLPGRYRLRAVQFGEDGEADYAVEVPFERARDEAITRSAGGGVIVQPGNSLWVISREVYGEGRQYTILFAANADQIQNPDLIYPGQVFEVPED